MAPKGSFERHFPRMDEGASSDSSFSSDESSSSEAKHDDPFHEFIRFSKSEQKFSAPSNRLERTLPEEHRRLVREMAALYKIESNDFADTEEEVRYLATFLKHLSKGEFKTEPLRPGKGVTQDKERIITPSSESLWKPSEGLKRDMDRGQARANHVTNERLGYMFSRLSALGDVPLTVLAPRPDKPAGYNFGSLQERVRGFLLYDFEENLIEDHFDELPKAVQIAFLEKGLYDTMFLNSDNTIFNTSNMLLDMKNDRVRGIDNAFISCYPYIARIYASYVATVLEGRPLDNETLDKTRDFQKQLQRGDVQEKTSRLVRRLGIEFPIYGYMNDVANKVLTEKTLPSIFTIEEDPKFRPLFYLDPPQVRNIV